MGLCLRPAYVLNTPCDCRHVSPLQTQTRRRHMSLTCWTALSTPHPPHAGGHAGTHAHSHPSSPQCCWSTAHVCSNLHWGRVPCTTTLLFTKTKSGATARALGGRNSLDSNEIKSYTLNRTTTLRMLSERRHQYGKLNICQVYSETNLF